jgi:hypothetical protein
VNAAWNNAHKMGEVRIHVAGEAVHGHPLRSFDPNGHHFFLPHPDSCMGRNAASLKAAVSQNPDERFFQIPKIHQ